MFSMIISIVAVVLYFMNVITAGWGIVLISAVVALEIISGVLYFKFGFLKCWYHDILGWHTPNDSPHYFDGCSEHATCKYCGKDIKQDSQGNWF